LPAPEVADISEAYVYYVGQIERVITFANAGGGLLNSMEADPAGCAVEPALPSGLSLAVSADRTSCIIMGTTDAMADETVYTVTATNVGGSDAATITITVLAAPVGDPVLADIAGVQTYIAGTAIAPLDFVNTGSPPLSCMAKAEAPLPAGLMFAATPDGASCRLIGMPTAQTASDAYTLVAGGVSGADVEASVTIDVLAVGATLAAPDLSDVAVMADAIANNALTAQIANTGGPIASCLFLDSSQEPATLAPTLDGLLVAAAADGSACDITGSLADVGSKSVMVRAANITGTDDAEVSFDVMASSLAMLSDTTTEFDVDFNVPLAATVVIANTNVDSRAGLSASSCVLLAANGDKLSPRATEETDAADEYEFNGLVLSTQAAADSATGACQITGTPDTAGRQVLRLRADTSEGSSAVLELTFIVRQDNTISFAAPRIDKIFGDAPFTNAATASNTIDITWSSSDTAVATVDADTGEVTILTVDTINITATQAQDDEYKGASADYILDIAPFPPVLPSSPIAVDAVRDVAIAPLTISATPESAAITACYFIDAATELATLNNLNIAKTGDRDCEITGTLNSVGAPTFTVRARSESGLAEVDVTFTVIPPLLAQLRLSASELVVDFNAVLTPVVITNDEKDPRAVLAAGNCVLVDGGGNKLDADPVMTDAYVYNGFVLSTVAAACQISGTPDTAGRNVLRVRGDTAEGSSEVVTLTFVVRQDNTLSFTA
ncbi:MAG: Ig-like domain-containing protein, partial [Proteobacteria bacterium]|nr:Ig-like domain-containing protein [Pseudomonadota bacterium]